MADAIENLWERLGNPETHNAALSEIAKAPLNVREVIDARSEAISKGFYDSEEGQKELADWLALNGEPFD